MFDQIQNLLNDARFFILGQPILFVTATGLAIATLSVAWEIFIYWAARLGGRPLIERLAARGMFRIDPRRAHRAEILFARWGLRLVVIGRIFPGMRTLISVPAGLTGMPFWRYAGAAFAGAFTWNTLLVCAGYLLGFKVTLLGVSLLG